uniref:Cysteine rich with EGF like domains 2 n=1 Tax=Leptobrachium leishanense TaxID=445787 RepID=A0A8C5PDF6_9ANUR
MLSPSWSLAACLLLALCSPPAAAAKKEPCDTCRKLVERFHKGLGDTTKKNFGGGNTAWEEKTLARYESSEIRLVEIIEDLCDASDFECNLMVEEHEEHLEKWWFKMKPKHPDLLKWFCIDTIKVCCPSGTYGADCLACMGGSERPCNGNGFCIGDGTRGGEGTCVCKTAYKGPVCLECSDGFYSSERNDTHAVCSVCHEACKTCHGPTNGDCKDCSDGWSKAADSCVDVDECAAEEAPCKEEQHCLNTDGSFTCEACDGSCSGCTGEGPEKCKNCASGYALQEDKCTDINECDAQEKVCVRDNEDCINTPGGYRCSCTNGFEDKDGECVEILKPGEAPQTDSVTMTSSSDDDITAREHEDL